MKRSSRLIVVLAAAAVTFGSLYAFVGTGHWDRYDRYQHFPSGPCAQSEADNSN